MTEVTSDIGILGLMGENSKFIINEIFNTDLDINKIPFLSNKEFTLNNNKIRLIRITYVGE